MAHEIATINGRVAMAFTGETPWHRLGNFRERFTSVEQALEVGNLDWNVATEPMYVKRGGKLLEVPAARAVVRDVDNAILGTVGGDYRPLQNKEAFGVLQDACDQFGVTIETAGALGRGERCWMLAKMPERVEAVKGDYVDGYFLVTTGHDGGWSYEARLTPVRVVCANTVALAMRRNAVIKLRHRDIELARLDTVSAMITNLTGALKQSGETFTTLAKKVRNEQEIDAYINEVLGIPDMDVVTGALQRRLRSIKELVTTGRGVHFAPNTMWAAYNAVTQYVDHVRTAATLKRRLSADKGALFGPGAQLKVRALELAITA